MFYAPPIPGVTEERVSQMIAPYALTSSVPVMASSAPPAVAPVSATGSEPMSFASANHTHASKARAQRITMGAPATTYVWTYPTPYAPGVVPTCSGIAQVASGSTDLVNVQVVGDPTNTQCTFQINRASPGLLALLLGALSLNPTPLAYKLHLFALEA